MERTPFNSVGIAIKANGKRVFSHEYQAKVLEFVASGQDEGRIREFFGLTRGEFNRIVRGRARGLAKRDAVLKERTLRERVYEKAVISVEESLDPLHVVLEKSPDVVKANPADLLPTAVGHLRNRGQNAIKVLEGLGDFRRAGDEIQKEAPRVPMFSLPAGTKVRLTLDVPKEDSNGSGSDGGKVLEAEAVDDAVQAGEPSR